MSFDLGTLGAAVTLDTTDWRQKLNAMPREAESVGMRIAQLATGYFSGRALVNFAVAATKSYSDMQESLNRFDVVFASVHSQAKRIGNELENVYRLSTRSAHDMLASTGDILTGFEFSADAALKLSERSAKLAIDLHSFTNVAGGAKAANMALAAAMTGEMERLKAYSIVIRQDSDEYKNLVDHFMEAEGMTLLQAKAMTALELATRQSKNAIGDYLRPGRTLAQTQADLTEATEQFRAKIGEDLAGAMQGGMEGANSLLRAYNELDPALRRVIVTAAAVAAGSMALKVALAGVSTFRTLEKKLSLDVAAAQEGEATATGILTGKIKAQTAAIAENAEVRNISNAFHANESAKKEYSAAGKNVGDAYAQKAQIDGDVELKRAAVRAAQARIEAERSAHIEKIQHQQAEMVAERTKELAATRSLSTQMAMEKVRHFEAMQNRTREAYIQMQGPVEAIQGKRAQAMDLGPMPQSQMKEFERQIKDAEAPYRKLQQETQKASKEMDNYIQKAKDARKAEIEGTAAINQKADAANQGASAHFRASKGALKSLKDEQNALTALEKKQSAATKNVITQNGNLLASKNKQAATEKTLQSAINATTFAQNAQVVSAKAGTMAMAAMRKGALAAASGMKALAVAIGPVGWAMIALSAGVEIIKKMDEATRRAADRAADFAKKMNEANVSGGKQYAEDTAKIERLRELSSYSKLNNNEITESQRLISELSLKYGNFGASINTVTGKLTLQKSAIDRLIDSMKLQRQWNIQNEISAIDRNIKENEKVGPGKLSNKTMDTLEKAGPVTWALSEAYRWWQSWSGSDAFRNTQNNESLIRRRAQLTRGINQQDGNGADDSLESSKALRDLEEQRSNFEAEKLGIWAQEEVIWNRNLEVEKALRDMEERGQLNSKEGIELQKNKLALEQEYYGITKRIEEEKKTEERFKKESQKSYNQFAEGRKNKAIDTAIDDYSRNNQFGYAGQIIYEQMTKASNEARAADAEYKEALSQGASGTDEGREYLKELESIILKYSSEEDRYRDKGREIERQSIQRAKDIEASYAEKFKNMSSNAVGAWSVQLLSLMTGAADPARETADNTREMVRMQRKMKDNVLVYG